MRQIVVMAAAVLVVVACGKKEPEVSPAGEASLPPPDHRLVSTESLFRGARLYQEHCAQCHGPEAQGHPDWRNPKVAAAPPLDGSGDAWKRRKPDMMAAIKTGVKRRGQPVMPSWAGRLNDREIEDIIAWYQALWPPEMYERWRQAEMPASRPAG